MDTLNGKHGSFIDNFGAQGRDLDVSFNKFHHEGRQ